MISIWSQTNFVIYPEELESGELVSWSIHCGNSPSKQYVKSWCGAYPQNPKYARVGCSSISLHISAIHVLEIKNNETAHITEVKVEWISQEPSS
jgi:hypothetical protein